MGDNYCRHCGYSLTDDSLLYHYTSLETLNAILSNVAKPDNRTLTFIMRATEYRYLNDPTEGNYFKSKVSSFIQKDSEINRLHDKFEKLIQDAMEFSGVPYVLSFSRSSDSLYMWRCYSGNGAGVALGLNPDELQEAAHLANLNNHYSIVRKYTCRYLQNEDFLQEPTIKSNFQYIKERLLDEDINATDFRSLCESFMVFKDPGYIQEHEVRIVLFASDNQRVELRTSGNVIIPYSEISIPVSALKKVVIGPCANKETVKNGVQLLLDSYCGPQAGIDIEESSVPYRNSLL